MCTIWLALHLLIDKFGLTARNFVLRQILHDQKWRRTIGNKTGGDIAIRPLLLTGIPMSAENDQINRLLFDQAVKCGCCIVMSLYVQLGSRRQVCLQIL